MFVRALIVLLAVLNAGAAAWWIAHDPPPAHMTSEIPPGVMRLQLLAEAAAPAVGAHPDEARVSNPEAASNEVATAPAQRCFSFGPFASAEAGRAAAARLTPMVRTLGTRVVPNPTAMRGWRVYLPPLPSLEQAQAVAQRIETAGFDDYLVVREGEEANSIALGRYRSEAAARKRADALAAAGFAAQAAPLLESGAAPGAVWLDVAAEATFDPARAQAAVSAAQYRQADCAAAH